MSTVADAYRSCEQITRAQARNFYYGIRLLPPAKRSALCALYALARRIDDIGDGDHSDAVKADELAGLRKSVHDLDTASDPVLVAVADTTRRYPVPVEAFGELMDGVQADIEHVDYATFDQLVVYCRQVAGTVGRLCLSIFAPDRVRQPSGGRLSAYADQLGIALQQINILRDVREDLQSGRIYVPAEDRAAFGVTLRLDERGNLEDGDARLAALLRWSADRAGDWYVLGTRLLGHLDRRSAACCEAMAGIYRGLLDQIRTNPTLVYDQRLSLTGWQKARVAATALASRRRATAW
jgi:phytoene synthase